MKEKNKKNLDEAIRRLPQYEPQNSLWDSIEEGLHQAKADVVLHQAIAELPTYAPPASVWQKVVAELEPEQAATVRNLSWVRYAAAACVGFLLLFGVQKWLQTPQPLATNDIKVSIAYSEETIRMPKADFADMAADDEAFAIVRQVCRREMPVCKTNAFKELRMELKDLDIARKSLSKMVSTYDTDPTHLIQLARIERDRSDVLKKMVAMI